ncbi:uncharacterized protein (UPF0248 family) [Filibacter limicola]|uniref:Uncharacterized protein (UPF0248 family) n=1 Tax=Sporosarcina limicola TaxID=34101 RepID=A0A927MKV3_9BACL|nr:uncharacterized protein (UPF0248 family) [Sporosarcina limicola]
MRLRQRDLKTYSVYRKVVVKEPDGTTYEDVDPVGHTVQANVQPAGGKALIEIYGERLAYMLTAYIELGNDIQETDGVCIYVAPDAIPDYRVVAIRRWNTHWVIDLEKVRT